MLKLIILGAIILRCSARVLFFRRKHCRISSNAVQNFKAQKIFLNPLIETIKLLSERKIGFKSLQENIDTSTSGGKLIFHIFSALAEFERELIRERTDTGLKAARARGLLGGRPSLLDNRSIKRIIEMYDEQKNTVAEICKIYSISRPSFYNYLRRKRVKETPAVLKK